MRVYPEDLLSLGATEMPAATPITQVEIIARLAGSEALNKTLEFYQEFFKPYGYRVCIAGGAIRDLVILGDAHAIKDYDVWALGADSNDTSLMENINMALHDEYIRREYVTNPNHIRSPRRNRRYGLNSYICHTVSLPWMLPEQIKPWDHPKYFGAHQQAQLMLSPYSMQELADSFDWKNCRFAYDGETAYVDGLRYFYAHKLTLNRDEGAKLHIPMHTLSRGFYLQEKYRRSRYPVNVSTEDAALLGALVLHGRRDGKA